MSLYHFLCIIIFFTFLKIIKNRIKQNFWLRKLCLGKQPTDQSGNQLTNQPIDQSGNQLTNWPTDQLGNQPIDQSGNQPIDQSGNQLTNWPTDQLTNWETNWPTDQLVTSFIVYKDLFYVTSVLEARRTYWPNTGIDYLRVTRYVNKMTLGIGKLHVLILKFAHLTTHVRHCFSIVVELLLELDRLLVQLLIDLLLL